MEPLRLNVDLRPLNILSVCTGGGGLDLGIRLAIPEARAVCCVEYEATACAILASRMEEGFLAPAPIWTDLRTFDGEQWYRKIHILTGGYPCQPFSHSGRRKGDSDPRHLWPEVRRVVEECEAPVLFFENVEGHLSLGFEEVRDALLKMGYDVEAGLFYAEEVGAPHERPRLFILGSRDPGIANNLWKRLADSIGERVGGGDQRRHREAGQEVLQRKDGKDAPDKPRDRGEALVSVGGSAIGLFPPVPEDPGWWEILQGEPLLEPALCGLADELADGVDERWFPNRSSQIRMLGNGVVPACAAYAFGVLLHQMVGRPKT
jgi:DNA (cytosine-5)-methyltransferase 1